MVTPTANLLPVSAPTALTLVAMTPAAHPKLPPIGPAWAGILMGLSIAASLSHAHGVPVLPGALFVAATVVLVAIALGWARYRNPDFSQGGLGAWGMVAMGVLAHGSAGASVTGLEVWQAACWIAATPLGLWACLRQLRGFFGPPAFTWGLALVAPMVSATSGAQLWERGYYGDWMWWTALGCFGLSLLVGVPTFAKVYLSRPAVAPAMAGTYWIPLGIVGQSTAAAQILLPASPAAVYGAAVLGLGVPLAVYAMVQYYPSVAGFADYAPGWWGATFPVGTLSLGALLLADTTGNGDLVTLSAALLLLLYAHLLLAAVRAGTWWIGERARRQTLNPASATTSGSR